MFLIRSGELDFRGELGGIGESVVVMIREMRPSAMSSWSLLNSVTLLFPNLFSVDAEPGLTVVDCPFFFAASSLWFKSISLCRMLSVPAAYGAPAMRL